VQGSNGRIDLERGASHIPLPTGAELSLSLIELARLRQGIYRFFGALFLYPDHARLTKLAAAAKELQQNHSLAALAFYGLWQRLAKTLHELSHLDDAVAGLEGEHVRLFLVNPQAPPYESFFLDPQREMAGWIAAQLTQEYYTRGLALASTIQEPPDHVTVELEFMAHLCACEQASAEESFRALECQRAFLARHLAQWFPAFSRQVSKHGRKDLYVAAVEAADAFISYDRDLIDLLLERFRVAENHVPDRIEL
jgi:TorA maturation chaperone TorD